MSHAILHPGQPIVFELRFESLFNPGRALAFPCDESGRVELDALSEPARRNYFYARAVVGREFATPAVVNGGRRPVPAGQRPEIASSSTSNWRTALGGISPPAPRSP